MIETTLRTATREEATEHVKAGGGAFFILDPKAGDLKYIWDPENEVETEEAKRIFDRMTKPKSEGGEGYDAFYVKEGEPAERMTEFDPRAGKLHLKLVKALVRG